MTDTDREILEDLDDNVFHHRRLRALRWLGRKSGAAEGSSARDWLVMFGTAGALALVFIVM